MSGFVENEISVNANGGTEIAKRTLTNLLDPELLSNFQIISSRPRDFDWEKIRVMYFHDLPEDPESAKFRDVNFRNQFHKFVFISNWQYQRYQLMHGFPADLNSVVIETGINPAPIDVFEKKKEANDGKIRLVYTSTPQRGLDILVPAFEQLAQIHPEIHLDVFSSFKIYGWDEADKQFESLYERIRNHPQMTYRGFTKHDELLEHLNTSHIFAYPSTWPETSCRAMLEAMSAGLLCVHPNNAALPESSGSRNVMYHGDYVNKEKHLNTFANFLNMSIDLVKKGQEESIVRFNKAYVDMRYNLQLISSIWNHNLSQLLEQYPTIESRKKPTEVFTYRT